MTRSRSWPAILGVLLGLAGVLGYFAVVFRFGALLPRVRNDALPNWLLVVAGLALSAFGVARGGRRRLAWALAAVNVALAAAFAWMLYGGLSAVPPVSGPALGAPVPDFALVDQQGRTRRLADFRGKPLLLVFYRGHW